MSSTDRISMMEGASSLPELFRSVAEVRGEATALVDGDHRLSYAELDAASDALARRLLAHGVRPGQFVGVLLRRSAEAVVAILGVLKAGAAYLPIDPTYPAERIRFMVEDAEVAYLVADPADAGRRGVRDMAGVRVVPPDAPSPPDGAVIPPPAGGGAPAYLVYTSGSTGSPKGCMVTHHNVLSLLRSALPLFDVGTDDRWALFHSISFDVSVWELWACLATGATAVIVPPEAARSSPDLLDVLSQARVSVLCQVPSVFRSLALTYASDHRPALFLRYLIFAGESIELDVVRGFLDHFVDTPPTCVNMYGPTETTIYVTHQVLTPADFTGPVRTPIGVELPHVRAKIVDERGDTVPDGDAGELWIAGPAVVAGYLNRAELTSERFVVDRAEAERYYRTGDLVRRLADGSLEFLGRNDQQVKVRGYRIELGEVEAALRTGAGVRDAAVVATTTPGGASFLVAFVVPHAGAVPDPTVALRQHAAALLPEYMVPARYRTIEQLPLTHSGKLDRATLTGLATASRRNPG